MLKWEKSLIGAKYQMPKFDLFPFPLVCKYTHLLGLPDEGKSIDLLDREKKKNKGWQKPGECDTAAKPAKKTCTNHGIAASFAALDFFFANTKINE